MIKNIIVVCFDEVRALFYKCDLCSVCVFCKLVEWLYTMQNSCKVDFISGLFHCILCCGVLLLFSSCAWGARSLVILPNPRLAPLPRLMKSGMEMLDFSMTLKAVICVPLYSKE